MSSVGKIDLQKIDIMKSGAIFHLNDIRAIKSPPIIRKTPPSSSVVNRSEDITIDEAGYVNDRFERTYRSASSPALQIYRKAVIESRKSGGLSEMTIHDLTQPAIPWIIHQSSDSYPFSGINSLRDPPRTPNDSNEKLVSVTTHHSVGTQTDTTSISIDINRRSNHNSLLTKSVQTVISSDSHEIVVRPIRTSIHDDLNYNYNSPTTPNVFNSKLKNDNKSIESIVTTDSVRADQLSSNRGIVNSDNRSSIANQPDTSKDNQHVSNQTNVQKIVDSSKPLSVTSSNGETNHSTPLSLSKYLTDHTDSPSLDIRFKATEESSICVIETNSSSPRNPTTIREDHSRLAPPSTRKLSNAENNATDRSSEAKGNHSRRISNVKADSLTALFSSPASEEKTARRLSIPSTRPSSEPTQTNAIPKESMKQDDMAVSVTSTRSGRRVIPTNRMNIQDHQTTNNRKRNLDLETDEESQRTTAAKKPRKDPMGPSSSGQTGSDDDQWLPEEFAALYSAYSKTEVTAPDFWNQISVELKQVGISKSSKQCQDRWFQSLREAEQRRSKKQTANRNEEKKANHGMNEVNPRQPENQSISLTSYENKYLLKKKLGNAALKKLAEESVKASTSDNLFTSSTLSRPPVELSSRSISALASIAALKSPTEVAEDAIESRQPRLHPTADTKKLTISRAESGKMNYIANFRKRVRAMQRHAQDSLLSVPLRQSTLTNIATAATKMSRQRERKKAPRSVQEGSAMGFMSPSTGTVRIKLTRDSDEESDGSDES